MASTRSGRRPEDQPRTGAPPQRYSSASTYATAVSLERTRNPTQGSRNTLERFTPPSDDDIRREPVRGLRSSNRNSSPTGGGHRHAAGLESRESFYETASDKDDWSSADEWSDDASTLTDSDVEMEDGTGARGVRNPLLSGTPAQGSRYALEAQPAAIATGRNITAYSDWSSTGTRPSSHFNVTHGYSTEYPKWSTPSQYISHESTKKCTVCKIKPIYRSRTGKEPYKTCGLKCATKLEEEETRLRSSWQRSSSPRTARGTKCVVCKVKEPYYNRTTGKRFPTCGNTCAAILKSRPGNAPASTSKAVGMCEQCHKQPKAISKSTGRPYDFCGIECRDKRNGLLEKAVAGTCQMCLICLKGNIRDVDKPFCGPECYAAGASMAPTLIEIPRGHITFEKYHRRFQQGCDTSSDNQPTVLHMYAFAQPSGVRERYAERKDELEASQRRGRPPIEKDLWISVPRKCTTGDSGEVNPCSSPGCLFCIIVSNGFHNATFPEGVTLASTPTLASANLAGRARSARRTQAVLTVRLVHASKKMEEVSMQQIRDYGREMRKEHDVVKVMTKTGYRTRETGELYVFRLAAIMPLGCIVYQ